MEKTFNHKWKNENNVILSIKRTIGEPLSYKLIARKSTMLEKRSGVDLLFTTVDE